jgi:glucose-6-phosphate dehydrogenase assembly protein OpcA
LNNHIADITYHHPSRIILVLINQNSQSDTLSAHISAHCQLPRQDNQQICCEIITLNTGSPGVLHLSGALLPLLLPGLPLFVCLTDPKLVRNKDLLNFFLMSDRIIVDLSDISQSNILTLSKQLIDFEKISDLSWLRLAPWREAIAQFFDPIAGQPQPDEIVSIKIEHSSDRLFHALLILAWMAFQLRWILIKKARDKALFQDQFGAQVETSFQISESIQAHAGLSKISIETLKIGTLFVEIKNRTTLYRQRVKDGHFYLYSDMELLPVTDVELLCQELDSLHADPTFKPSLDMASVLFNN